MSQPRHLSACPPTAKGTVFLALEDEGLVQRQGRGVSVVARRVVAVEATVEE